jgi:tetratricopeptide (TPR) repeat protein
LTLGKCYLLSGYPIVAASKIDEVAELNPDSPQVHYLLGVAHLAGGHNQLGLQHLTTALTLDNNFTDAELVLAGYYYKTGEYEMANQHSKRVVKKEPENYRPYMISGAVYLDEGHLSAAQREFHLATLLDPDSISPIYFIALTDEASGKIDEALDKYERILSENPLLIDVARQYRNLLVKEGRCDDAMLFFKDATESNPENAHNFHHLGELYLVKKEYKLAIDTFNRAISIDPKMISSYMSLSKIFIKMDQRESAIETLKDVIAVDPYYVQGAMALAQLYLSAGDKINALSVLESAHSMNTDDATLLNNLAVIYMEDDANLNRAFELARQAYEKVKSNPASADTLGWAYYRKGVYRQAVWYLEEADQLLEARGCDDGVVPHGNQESAACESLSIVKYHLGMALIKSGDVETGRRKLERAIRLGLDDSDLSEATGYLSSAAK